MIIDRLKKLILIKKNKEKTEAVELIFYLDEVKIKLEKIKDIIKKEAKEYKKIRKSHPYLSGNMDPIDQYIINEDGRLYVVRTRLKEIKKIIEKIEEIITDAQGPDEEEEEEEECEPDAIDEEEEEECEEDY